MKHIFTLDFFHKSVSPTNICHSERSEECVLKLNTPHLRFFAALRMTPLKTYARGLYIVFFSMAIACEAKPATVNPSGIYGQGVVISTAPGNTGGFLVNDFLLTVKTPDHKTTITKVQANMAGRFTLTLLPGEYVIYINHPTYSMNCVVPGEKDFADSYKAYKNAVRMKIRKGYRTYFTVFFDE